MLKILIMLALSIVLSGCGVLKNDLTTLMKENQYVIIDVRTESEYNDSHIVGSINIPYDEIDNRVNLDREKTIFVYCKSGNRSSKAFKKLTDLGYKVYDLGAYSEIDLEKE